MRRSFLVSAGAASTAWSTQPASGRAPPTPLRQWTWPCPSCRLEIALGPTDVTVSVFPPDAPASPQGRSSGATVEPMIDVGADRRPVTWRDGSWQEPDDHHRVLTLDADGLPLKAVLSFARDAATGLLSLHPALRHVGQDGEIDLRTARSFAIRVCEPVDRMLYLTGGWTEETEIQRAHPDDGVLTLESRSGKTGFQFQPYIALRTEAATYLCQIFWSGNWCLQVEPKKDTVLLSGGLNDWHLRHRLAAGESLQLPTVLFGRIAGSLNAGTQRLHDLRRALRPNPDRAMPVQFNSWYPYLGEPTAGVLMPLVPIAKRIGCEAFVVDAGWYRTDDGESEAEWAQRTGDWRTSRKRFPRGLREVSDACHTHGLAFGLWFEPEVISSSSSIRREHPEWLHHIDGEAPAPDDRAVLNLGVPAAWDHVFERLTRMLRVIGVDWMKWDFNTDLGAGGWAPGLPADLVRRDPLVAHYEGLYRLQDALRAAFPDLVLEMCAGGGGRMDGEILSHAHVNWMSDQAGAVRKLAIHFGTQLAHPAVVCNDWLIDWPGDPEGQPGQPESASLVDARGDLAFRLRVAMLGTFGISAPIDRWPPADVATTASHVALYVSKVRPLLHFGDQYYLTRAPDPDGSSDWAAIWYAAKDGASGVLFAFRLAGTEGTRRFRLPGLREESRYRVTLGSGEAQTLSGMQLADGLEIALAETFRSELCLVAQV
ncbi:MAG TPA: alpha-galactosidase [Reyranella sp.]|jgi:alpha-galactosidase